MRSLRGRVAVAAVCAVAVIAAVLSALLVLATERDQRAELDGILRQRADLVATVLSGMDLGNPAVAALVPRDLPRPVFGFQVTDAGGTVILSRDVPVGGLRIPLRDGYATVPGGGTRWRSYVTGLGGGGRLQVVAPLRDQTAVVQRVRRRVIGLTVGSIAAAGALAWAFAGVAVRPLERLRAAAGDVAEHRDLSLRVPAAQGAAEVDAVAERFNAMLARLEDAARTTETALEASRRFAADAGHELRTPLTSIRANLEVLQRNPELPVPERTRVLDDVDREQARLLGLLDSLQLLARGDAAAAVPREGVDLAEVLDSAVAAAVVRHPRVRVALDAPEGPLLVTGWADGLRVLADNLLENAARHGASTRPDGGGTVAVLLSGESGAAHLLVDDDGPGVPEPEREAVFDRFVRGTTATGAGSGLGLALVAQQVALHGGSVALSESPLGGARVTVLLPGR